ncbi:DUF3800 domain-containing protein [Rhizobium leguminosarum bv. viciae]|jgi:hypothetical protein|uniref:DUF3800 domain-containing protein n=1 Tax=Rhizobium leguminosarum TaxID=384 RepID=UPI00103894C6|nr:DUF3800 domain-containing protein [Rhizobium leguminosarum]MBY5515922.1 DUF3800 domain-containing protein [Rhizobium leguminosarum]TBY60309.1 DUF3800 domain-containing protein [Rhizobium leguminosarum bv. viciae]
MQLLYCDETNLEEKAGDFLIYGGLIVPCDVAKDISSQIDKLRVDFGVPKDYVLKFNPGPKGMPHTDFIQLKQQVLQLAEALSLRLIVYTVLHDIAVSADEARRYGINTVCFHFDSILRQIGDTGLVLIDRFNDQGNEIDAHLRDKFMIGLKDMPYSKEIRLENIVGFHYSAIGQSHCPSLIDIMLGSLRFAVNAHTRKQLANVETARALLHLLSPLLWRDPTGGAVPEVGFQFSPKIIKAAKYRDMYQGLKEFLFEHGVETKQVITDQRGY